MLQRLSLRQISQTGMGFRSLKYLLVLIFSLSACLFSTVSISQHADPHQDGVNPEHGVQHKSAATEEFKPGDVLMEHIMDAHEFHFAEVGGHPITIPLPVILYSPQRGFTSFMSSKLEHGHAVYNGYKLEENNIIAVDEKGKPDETVKVYDFSITRNVAQMFLALIVLVLIMTSVAKKYVKRGAHTAPTGMQNLVEPVITFIRDEVGKVNLGHKYEKYMPYLLTVFFFVLINNLFGLIPGSANVTGNIAFTMILAIISLIVILFSANRHFWGHIFNPPVPGFVKPIMVLVEFLGIFTKPFALMVRLFANMVAGHMIITCLVMLIFIFATISKVAGIGFSPVSLAFTIFIYCIEVLVAFIQAFIFTNLTAVFIGQAFEGEHHDGHDHTEDPVII